jgi:hypothetical protein
MTEFDYFVASFLILASISILMLVFAILLSLWLRRNCESKNHTVGRHDYWDSRRSIHPSKTVGEREK